ncbi:MAG TPA: hypothetical protein VMH50_18175, partial [Thermoleophilia bacterium]|nr:hypothetical protein [Thermoleophilia bacterium]
MATSRSALSVLSRLVPRKGARRTPALFALASLLCLFAVAAVAYADTATFTAEELLGKPTDTSVTVNVVPASSIQYSYQY